MPLWFVAIFVPMIGSQILRIYQHDPWAWLALDYAGRIGALAILIAIPAARTIAFAPGARRVAWIEVTAWTIGLVLFDFYAGQPVMHAIDRSIPGTALGDTPNPIGTLRLFDMSAGLALVAYQEEVVFRRCARAIFGPVLYDGWLMVLTAALLFGAYHWWTGIGNIVAAALFGIVAMLFLRRVGLLWPIVLAHYAVDAITFYG